LKAEEVNWFSTSDWNVKNTTVEAGEPAEHPHPKSTTVAAAYIFALARCICTGLLAVSQLCNARGMAKVVKANMQLSAKAEDHAEKRARRKFRQAFIYGVLFLGPLLLKEGMIVAFSVMDKVPLQKYLFEVRKISSDCC
jgi:hypothetical protein